MNEFEDTWLDVILKAMRGHSLTEVMLSEKSGISLHHLKKLLSGTLDQEILCTIAPSLALKRNALLKLANDRPPKEISLPKNMRRFTTLHNDMQVHSYLLWSEQNSHAIAFDTGTDLSFLLREMTQHQLTLQAIFLTHGHADHVLQLKSLIELTGTTAWSDQAEEIKGAKSLTPHFVYHLDKNICLEARLTPGHSPGGTTYFLQGLSSPVAIVGDALFARSIGGIPPASYSQGLQAIRKNILSLPPKTILAAGHGPLTTVEEELQWNPFFI